LPANQWPFKLKRPLLLEMSNPLVSPTDYSIFIHALPQRYTSIERSSLVYIPLGVHSASYPNKEKLYWYDSFPHPNNPALASTHPHHKHVPPDIKRNRIPAPNLTFTAPNLPFLIEEIEREVLLS
jgi:hypothetical protein